MEPNTKRKRGDFFREAVSSSKASITGVAKVLRVVKKALESDPSILKSASKSSVSRAIHEMTADEGLYGTISDTMQVQLADGSQYNWERKAIACIAALCAVLFTDIQKRLLLPRTLSTPWRFYTRWGSTMAFEACCSYLSSNICIMRASLQTVGVFLKQQPFTQLRLESMDGESAGFVLYWDELKGGNPLRPDKASACLW